MTATQNMHTDAAVLADLWYRKQSMNEWGAFYPYYAPGELDVASEAPAGMELAHGVRLSPAWTRDEVRNHLVKVLYRTPYLTA